MREHNIVFWDKLQTPSQGRVEGSAGHAVQNFLSFFFRYSLLQMTPPIVMIGLVMDLPGIVVRGLGRRCRVYPRQVY